MGLGFYAQGDSFSSVLQDASYNMRDRKKATAGIAISFFELSLETKPDFRGVFPTWPMSIDYSSIIVAIKSNLMFLLSFLSYSMLV